MKYISVSPYWAIDEIEKGKTVYCFDKDSKEFYILNDLDLGTAVEVLQDAKAHSDKYDIWYEVKENTENETV